MDLVYLDNNATTALASEALAAMMPFLTQWYGNASSVHRLGQRSRQAIDQARARVAEFIGCADSEIVFTAGATEAVNTAIRSLLEWRTPRRRIVTTTVEHSATRELCRLLAGRGYEVVEVPVDHAGRLDLQALAGALDDQAALLTTMWANNETGVIFPVDDISRICREKKVPLHCDGTQAVGKIPVDVKVAGMDMMSLAAHKFHGPKGAAALYVRRGLRLRPLIVGGPQENQRRGGTENVAAIVGMGRAAELAATALPQMQRVAAQRDRLEREVLSRVQDTHVNGATDQRLPNTTNISFARLQAEAILLLLSEQGICASAGAACSSGSLEPSHVLKAMGIDQRIASGAIRFSLSRYTTDAEIQRTIAVLPDLIARLRKVLPVGI
jgi:cysteine desulfurase